MLNTDCQLVFLQSKVLPATTFLSIMLNYQMQSWQPCGDDKNWDMLPLEGVQGSSSSMFWHVPASWKPRDLLWLVVLRQEGNAAKCTPWLRCALCPWSIYMEGRQALQSHSAAFTQDSRKHTQTNRTALLALQIFTGTVMAVLQEAFTGAGINLWQLTPLPEKSGNWEIHHTLMRGSKGSIK